MREYIKKLSLRNFQSHHESDLEFSPGLNIIVGPSDQGKSAIIRALRWLIYNEPRGTGFIRSGETRCMVRLEMSNGVSVERVRDESRKINRYVVEMPGMDPMVFERFNKEVPLEVRQALGICKLVVDRDRAIEINTASQLEAPFLLEESGGSRSKVLGRMANLHIIDAAQRDATRDIGQATQEIGRLTGDIQQIDKELLEYLDLEDREKLLQELVGQMEMLKDLEERLVDLQELRDRWMKSRSGLDEINLKLRELDYLDDASALYNQIGANLGEFHEMQEMNDMLAANLRDSDICLNTIRVTEEIELTYKSLEEIRDLRQQGFELQTTRRLLRGLEIERNTKEMDSAKYHEVMSVLDNLDQIQDELGALKAGRDELKRLEDIADRFVKMQNGADEAVVILKECKARTDGIAKAYGDVLQQAGRCPTCFAEIDLDVVERIRRETL